MKLDVPFYKQKENVDCGPVALKMVLSYFGKNYDIENLKEKTGIKKGKGISTIQIATAAALLGHKTDFYSKSLFMDEENFKMDFYKKYAEDNLLEQSKQLIEEAKKAGVKIEEKKLTLKEILTRVNENEIPIILLDWNVVKENREKGYQGHFVPIVGYDEENIYVHNQGLNNPTEFLKIKKEIFEEARKAKGTDEDIVIICRAKQKNL